MYTGGDLKFNWSAECIFLAWFGKALNMLAISQELNRNPHYEIGATSARCTRILGPAWTLRAGSE